MNFGYFTAKAIPHPGKVFSGPPPFKYNPPEYFRTIERTLHMILDDWQRIEKIVRWTGLSVNSFALNIGLNRGENLYQIKRGNNGISKDLAELISAKYPEISRAWIITGEGEMFVSDSQYRHVVPCYDNDALYLASLEDLPQPASLISLPKTKEVTFAALNLSSAMEPRIPVGAMMLLSETREDKIIPGLPYLIVSDRITVVRIVKREPQSTNLRLAAVNKEYDDIMIDECELRKLYLIKGHIYYNN